jgi:hypothetical protein
MVMKRNGRIRSLIMVAAGHLLAVSLSVGCGSGASGLDSGDLYLRAPDGAGDYHAQVGVKFTSPDVADYGVFEGYVIGGGCFLWVSLCDDKDCQKVFKTTVPDGKRYEFSQLSSQNEVFDHFIGKLDGGYTRLDSCGARTFESHQIDIRLDTTGCHAEMHATMSIETDDGDDF